MTPVGGRRADQPPAPGGKRRVACGCGFVVEGAEDEVVATARRHASEAHGIELTDALLRALAEPA